MPPQPALVEYNFRISSSIAGKLEIPVDGLSAPAAEAFIANLQKAASYVGKFEKASEEAWRKTGYGENGETDLPFGMIERVIWAQDGAFHLIAGGKKIAELRTNNPPAIRPFVGAAANARFSIVDVQSEAPRSRMAISTGIVNLAQFVRGFAPG
jgi:hypothetical protein